MSLKVECTGGFQVHTSCKSNVFMNINGIAWGCGVEAVVYTCSDTITYLHRHESVYSLMQFASESTADEYRKENPDGEWTRLDQPRPTQEPKKKE